ncbi:MAG: hypothetical protein K2G87_03415 [Oscillospiraceae bacterium]|nr:hypothetical protein [Oscillospiraceae bacterium]
MIKKFFSVLICMSVIFCSVTAAFSSSPYAGAEAAKIYETPYYYSQLTDNAQKAYNALKKAVLNCEKSVKISYEVDKNDLKKIAELLIFHDPMTFNLKDISVLPYSNSIRFKLMYRYDKETYDKMVSDYKKETSKILDKLTDDMSVYKKIRIIHDSIVNSAVYDLDSDTNDTIYGTLVKRKGKCDGYSKSFSYVCGQAGIRTVTVIGDDLINGTDTLHMWNKVYYNKKWYNVDVTWDDPVGNVKENLQYDFFMVSDDALKNTHSESNFSFDVPKANDNTKNYFVVNNKYAEDLDSAKEILNSELASASSKKKSRVVLKCSSESVYKEVKKYILNSRSISKVIKNVNKDSKNKLISDIYSYKFNEDQYIITLYVFYEDSELDDYFTSTDELSKYTLRTLALYGIE